VDGCATVRDNLLQGNIGSHGGGLYGGYGQSTTTFDGNRFLSNTAAEQGGGAYLYRDSGAVYRTTFVANQAQQGGGSIFHEPHHSRTQHFRGQQQHGRPRVVIDKYPGLINPGAPEHTPASAAFTNTIFAGHTVAIFATAGNTLSVDGVLWHDTAIPIDALAPTTTQQHEFTGDPRLRPMAITSGPALQAAPRSGHHDRQPAGCRRPIPPAVRLGPGRG